MLERCGEGPGGADDDDLMRGVIVVDVMDVSIPIVGFIDVKAVAAEIDDTG